MVKSRGIMRQYLVEGVTGAFPFIVDRSKLPVTESRPNGSSLTRIPGRFSVCDCVNGNKRRYGKRVWEKNLQPGSILQDSIAKNGAFGLLEHPKDGIVTLLSPISHHVTKAEMVESRDASGKVVYEVFGEIALLDTEEGRKLKALIEGGYNPLVSSRGYGSLSPAADGVDDVQDDYVCEGWDVVIKPSFENAELTPNRSTTTAQMAEPYRPNPQAESKADTCAGDKSVETLHCDKCGKGCSSNEHKHGAQCPSCKSGKLCCEAKALKESTPSSGAVNKPISETKQRAKTMELNDIRSRIQLLTQLDISKPQRFAESIAQVDELHQQVAEWAAADPKRSWEAQKLHSSLDKIAEGFTDNIKAPAKEAKRLSEQNHKLMKVINAVAGTAVTYKKKLGESMKADSGRVKMIEELTRRGQGWQRVAEGRKQKFVTLEKDFNDACEALDLIAERYHEDVTELGRRVIVLEFKEKAQTPEIQKALKEATRLRHIAAIREKLEGKKNVQEAGVEGKKPAEGEAPSKEAIKDDKQKGAGSPEAGKVAKEPGAVKNESKEAEGKTTVTEAKVLKQDRADLSVRNVNESVDLVRRLSGAPAAK